MNFKNKKIVIMGLGSYEGGSGISAALYFLRKGAKLLITDLKTKKQLAPQIKRLSARTVLANNWQGPSLPRIRYVLGKHRKKDFQNADFIFKNPGVPKDSPYIKIARKNRIPIINDWTIYFQERPNNLLIGITGTKGKSTTAVLIHRLLKNSGKDVVLCGNIGQSPLAILNKIKKTSLYTKIPIEHFVNNRNKKGTVVAAELSSWLLHDFTQSPQIAVITNLMPEHLDKYKNAKEYYRDKENIFRFQGKNDYLVLNKNDANLRKLARKAKSHIIWYDGQPKNAASVVAKILKIQKKTAEKTIKNFEGLPGRLELIRVKNGLQYINDTTATMPDATIYALNSLEKHKSRIILIAGGVDKKLDYKNLAKEILKYCKTLILFKGTASEKMIQDLKIVSLREISRREKNCKLKIISGVSSMKQAISISKQYAINGDVVLLSPGAASFNMFKNEFDRGEQFVKFVKHLKI